MATMKKRQARPPSTKRSGSGSPARSRAARDRNAAKSEAARQRGQAREIASPSAPQEPLIYDPAGIEDAPEFHALARAVGSMTWGTWDTDPRPFEERVRDFLFAYPPRAPTKSMSGRLIRQRDGTFAPGTAEARRERFVAWTWDHGTLHEVLSRFGLRMRDRPPYEAYVARLASLRDVAKRRNVKLRVLHGGVDVEPSNMDAAKADYLDRQEKKEAARDVRAARARMKAELASASEEEL